MSRKYENWWGADTNRMESPPKTSERKPKTKRQLEITEWKCRYKACFENLWDVDVCATMISFMAIFGLISLYISLENVSRLDWMYGWLKAVICLSAPILTGLIVWGFFYIAMHIVALSDHPYPLPKFDFKKTYKFNKD